MYKENDHADDYLHGVKLKDIVKTLIEEYGWEELGERIDINCFIYDPTLKSSLKFLRRFPWARNQVEALYVTTMKKKAVKAAEKVELID